MRGVYRFTLLGALALSFAGPSCAARAVRTEAAAEEPLPVSHGAARGPLSLRPGELAEIDLTSGKASVWLPNLTGDERFVVILGSTRFERGDQTFAYRLALVKPGVPSAFAAVRECSLSPDRWRDVALESETPPSGTAPAPGASRELRIATPSGVSTIMARAVSVGTHATIWADTTHPTTLDATFTGKFLEDFERVILPRSRQIFGTESDLDGDGRVQLVFSSLTRERGVAFFTGCDLAKLEGCPASNTGEYLYLTPPDAIDPPYNTPNAIKEILTHELGHLLHFNQKVLKNRLTDWQDGVFLAEGIGALAQDVSGYQAGNLYVTKAGLDGIATFSLGAVFDARGPEDQVDGVLRGGAYLFVRYLYDRAGGDAVSGLDVQNRGGPAFLRALISAPEPIGKALFTVARTEPASLALDFFSALALSGRDQVGGVAPKNPCFAFLPAQVDPVTGKQRGMNPFAQFHGSKMSGPALGEAAAPDGTLRAGGVEYLTLGASAGASEVAFELEVDPAAKARLRVARVN